MKKLVLAAALSTLISTDVLAKDFAIESNPLGLAIGLLNGSFLYDVSDKVSLGPTLSYWSFDLGSDDQYTYLNLGARVELMPKGNDESGLYIAGSVNRVSFSVEATDGALTCDAAVTALGATATGGYKHIGAAGFIAKVGAGYGLGTAGNLTGSCSDNSEYDESADLPFGGLAFEWTLGYKF